MAFVAFVTDAAAYDRRAIVRVVMRGRGGYLPTPCALRGAERGRRGSWRHFNAGSGRRCLQITTTLLGVSRIRTCSVVQKQLACEHGDRAVEGR